MPALASLRASYSTTEKGSFPSEVGFLSESINAMCTRT
jgi:hypothetical protein